MKRKAALPWQPHYDGFEAQTAIGTYQVHENIGLVRGTFGASFQPPQGRSRLPKEWQGLGIIDTVEEAKALMRAALRRDRAPREIGSGRRLTALA
jgi:hypothetical protein